MNAYLNEAGAMIKSMYNGAVSWTAAGTGDATAVTGTAVDVSNYSSAKVILTYTTTLAAAKTLAFAVEYQGSADNSTFDTATAIQASTVAATGGSGGSTATGVVEFDINLQTKKKYLKFNWTPDLNATGTDTAIATCTVLLLGATTAPNTNA